MDSTAVTVDDLRVIQQFENEPAPLLPILHAFHERDGHLSDRAIRAVSKRLRIPVADLFGTVTFYHHFSRTPGGASAPRVCTGPVCSHAGAAKLLDDLAGAGATPMPCAGRCDQPVPAIRRDRVLIGRDAASLAPEPSPLPPPYPGTTGECVFSDIRTPGQRTLSVYRAAGGYEALASARFRTPEPLLALVEESGLAGRGGAGFPTGRKWRAVADAPGDPKVVVCNADEGEPGCFKDRALLDHDPHAVIEGMALAARATGATLGFIYLRYEYPETFHILRTALREAAAAGFIADPADPGAEGFKIYLRRGAGAYICGEETSLLNSLEGKHPFPRNRPPYPVTHGFNDRPTAVNNVETLASVPKIARHGAAWYRSLGLGGHPGTKIISLSGDIRRSGNFEVPIGLPLKTLLEDWAGGPPPGRSFKAVTMAGLSGGFLPASEFDATLDEPSLRSRGSFLGAGGIIVYDDSRDMAGEAREAMAFFAHESCGKCFPCRIGTERLAERLDPGLPQPPREGWRTEIEDLGEVMRKTSACGLGQAAPLVTDSLLRHFPADVDAYLRKAIPGTETGS